MMDEMKCKVEKLANMKEQLVCCMEAELAKGANYVDTKEAGEVIDMIKDLAEAEEKCWKACYYKQIVEAMEESKEMEKKGLEMEEKYGEGRRGYDNWRYSSGRFAPTGRGHYAGYIPMMPPYMDRLGYIDWDGHDKYYLMDGRSGYTMGRSNSGTPGGGTSTNPSRQGNMGMDRSGYRPYDAWNEARRHYHESGRIEDKHEMDEHAQKHMMETVSSIKDIWDEADPQMKMKLRRDMEELMQAMK